MKEILQFVIVPVITALITAVITYTSTKANNKTKIDLAVKNQEIKLKELNNLILIKDKELEQLKLSHELELKSKEADMMNPIIASYVKEVVEDPSKIIKLIELQEKIENHSKK